MERPRSSVRSLAITSSSTCDRGRLRPRMTKHECRRNERITGAIRYIVTPLHRCLRLDYSAIPRFNMAKLFVICLLLALSAGTSSAFAEKRNITEKDLFDFVWIGDPQVSPDGSRVAFVRVTVNEKKEGYNTSIWTVPLEGGEEPHQLTKGDHDSVPRWSPDGKFLLFPARD